MNRFSSFHQYRFLPELLVCFVVVLYAPVMLNAQDDPRDENCKPLPEIGTMVGTITKPKFIRTGEEFGSKISAVGSIGSHEYGSWIIARNRADTSFGGHYPDELVLYSGQPSQLPLTTEGVRIGPTLIASESLLHAAGDWNSDGYTDLFVDMSMYGDTSFGNTMAYGRLAQLAVCWGNAEGTFNLDDTTRIPSPGDSWMGARDAFSSDFDGDGLTDLLLWEAGYWQDSLPHPYPTLAILKGTRGSRWGDPGIPIFSGWTMTNIPSVSRIEILDHDADSALDIAFHQDRNDHPGYVAVLYGRRGAFPDTSDVEGFQLYLANGHYSLFSDITGDGAPELLVNTGTPELIRIYAGRPGQRLNDQYGTGYDPPIEGKGWWRRPWAEIWLPNKFDDRWTPAGWGKLFDLGDANLDGINDIWAFSEPYLVCFTGGKYLDSLVDATVFVPGTEITSITNVGVIDDSGVPAIAIGYDYIPHVARDPFPGGVLFVQPDRVVPSKRNARRLPDLPRASEVQDELPITGIERGLSPRVFPNPARDRILIRWRANASVSEIKLISLLGKELRRMDVGPMSSEAYLDLTNIPAGTYFITVRTTTQTETVPVVID